MKTSLACILVILCATVFSATAAAPPADRGPWYLYWMDKDGSESYISMKYYNVNKNNTNRVRVLTYIDRPRTGQHTNVVELFDCTTHQVARLTMSDYDAKGVEIKRYEKDDEIPEWQMLDSNEINRISTLYNGACLGQAGGMPALASETAKYFQDLDAEVRKISGH